MRLLKTTVAAITAAASLATAQAALAETTVSFWTFREQEQPLWDRVNAEGLIPGVKVEMTRISSDDYESRLRIALQQGGPDIFQAKSGAAWFEPFVGAGVVAPISKTGVDVSKLNGLIGVTGSDGQLYGVPGSIQLQSVIYNKASLEELGFDAAPRTAADFEKLMKAAKDAGYVGLHHAGRAGWWINQVLNEVVMAGLVSDATQEALVKGTKCFTDAEVVGALEKFASWAPYFNANATADDYGAMRTAVALGDSVGMVDGAWSTGPTSPMYELNPDFVPVFGPIPGSNGKVVAHADGGYAVNANAVDSAAVKAVLEFMTTEKFAQLFVEEVTEVPAYAGKLNVADARVNAILAELTNAASTEPYLAYDLNKGKPSYAELSAQVYQKMFNGELTAAQAAAEIQAGLNSWGYVGANKCK